MTSAFNTQLQKIIIAVFTIASLFGLNALHAQEAASLPDYVVEQYGFPPVIPTGPLSPVLQAAVKIAFTDSMAQSTWGRDQSLALVEIADSKDPRIVWVISDLMRFASGRRLNDELTAAAAKLLGKDIENQNSWGLVTDHLIAWDVPAPPEYLKIKRGIFTTFVPGWEKIFVEGNIDWRMVSWGGVLIDNRAYDKTDEA